ncbi:hypothetical protein D3C81_1838990 [compost metagenome]
MAVYRVFELLAAANAILTGEYMQRFRIPAALEPQLNSPRNRTGYILQCRYSHGGSYNFCFRNRLGYLLCVRQIDRCHIIHHVAVPVVIGKCYRIAAALTQL